jgi:hypothetical protein
MKIRAANAASRYTEANLVLLWNWVLSLDQFDRPGSNRGWFLQYPRFHFAALGLPSLTAKEYE